MSSDHVPSPGDFGLVPVPAPLGHAIKLGIWLNGDGLVPVQHAFLYVGAGKIIESVPGGAVINSLARSTVFRASAPIYWHKAPKGVGWDIAREGVFMRGTPYSFLDYVSLAAERLGIRNKALMDYVADTGHMICSQLVDEAYRRAGVHLFDDGRIPGDVTPGDLFKLINT